MVYEDPDSQYKVRKADWDSKEDIQLFIKTHGNFWREAKSHRRELPFPEQWMTCVHIGGLMEREFVEKDFDSWVILDENDKPVATANSFPSLKEYGFYPIICVSQLESPFRKQLAKALLAVAHMFKEKGYNTIYAYTIATHPLEKMIPTRRKIGDWPFPPRKAFYTLWEMDL
jgi:hypothetical protein